MVYAMEEIIQLKKEIQIYETFLLLSPQMFVSLEHRGVDCREYSKKLYRYAEVYVMKEENDIEGVIAFYCNDFQNSIAFLTNIVVRDIYRGQGVASRMLKQMFRICNERKMCAIGLEVHRNNMSAKALYIKHGFREIKMNEEFVYMEKSI